MSDLRAVINDHWRALGAVQRGTAWLTSALPVESAGLPMLCAIGPDGNRHLLVPLPPGDRPRPDLRSAAVHLLPLTLEPEARPVHYADLVLLRADLAEIFTGLCADVLAALAAEPDDVLVAIGQVLGGWRELLRSGSKLGIEQLAGLFGELTVLNRLLDLRPDLLKSWQGPLRAPQDFVLNASAIEVKATASSEGRIVRIHGIDQLAAPAGGLMLWWLRLDTGDTGGIAVPELIRSTARRLDRPQDLWQLLARSGYFMADADRYKGLHFTVVEEAHYRVAEDFPRIVAASLASDLPPGVSDVRYAVDLNFAPAPMQEDEVADFLDSMVGRG
ncbi:PD-(D/E)XK motif protein [Actinoplanes sp. NPDC048967]|uniref:PD-(D/E)XK motif protein n=1 Tax=Actinoplanes sp. NPDC048967 TaxID=3155269 RepID=UPI0033EB2BC7